MTRRTTLVSTASAVLILALPASALACPEGPPPLHRAAFLDDEGAVARSGDTIVELRGDDAATTRSGLGNAYVAISPDGSLLVMVQPVHVASEGVAPCTNTHLWMHLGDPRGTETTTRMARLRGETLRSLRFSHTGRFVSLAVHGPPAAHGAGALGADRVHIFDLHSRRRRYVLDGTEATFLDDRHLVLRDARSRLTLHRVSDGERIRVLIPPARRTRPFAEGASVDGFFATARLDSVLRFIRVHLGPGGVRLEPRGPALTERPLSISSDGSRGAWLSEGRTMVRDLSTGDDLASFGPGSGPPPRGVVIAPDGSAIAIMTHDGAELHGID